jgi:hypothetical protein
VPGKDPPVTRNLGFEITREHPVRPPGEIDLGNGYVPEILRERGNLS